MNRTPDTLRFVSSRAWTGIILFALTTLMTTAAQETATPTSTPTAVAQDYKIASGDVLSINVSDAPEFGGKFRVSDAGVIQIAAVEKPVTAEGLTPIELSHSIREALIGARQLRDPRVNVFVDEFHGRTITVLGSVTKPGVYPLNKHTNVMEALSFAGGPLPNSGNTLTIVRGPATAEATGTAAGSVQIIDVGRLTHGQDLNANVEVRNGDVVNVSAAQLIYVVGAVTKPGGFVMSSPSEGVSVVQAIALAEGFKSIAATHRGLIIRQSTSAQGRTEIPVDVASLMVGKEADQVLAPNDILFIPESGTKKTLKVLGDIGMAAVNGAAVYGLGYRLGTANF